MNLRTFIQEIVAPLSATLLCVVSLFFGQASVAEVPPFPTSIPTAQGGEQEATHIELRALRDALFAAWEKRDLESLLTHVAPNVVVTWQNGEVNRGHAGIRKFYEEVMGGPDKLVSNVSSTLNVDELSIFYGDDTAIAFGSIHDDLTLGRRIARAAFLGSGSTIAMDSRWTATLIRIDGQWKLASYHVSADAFSNPILAQAIKAGELLAVGAGIGGLIVGAIAAWLFLRRRIVKG